MPEGNRFALAIILFVFVVIAVHAYYYGNLSSFGVSDNRDRRPVRNLIVDTDAGEDDLVALAYLLALRKTTRVRLVTVAGNSWCTLSAGFRNIQRFLDLQSPLGVGAGGKNGSQVMPIEAFPGVELSWVNQQASGLGRVPPREQLYQRMIPEAGRAAVDALYGAAGSLPPSPRESKGAPPSAGGNGVEEMKRLLRSPDTPPRSVDVLCMGGATNVATVLRECPECARSIRRIVFMGGAVFVSGNFGFAGNPKAESNAMVDPQALDFLLSVPGVDFYLVSLDATNWVPYNETTWSFLTSLNSSEYARTASSVLKRWRRYVNRDDFLTLMYPWDIVAAVIAADDDLFHAVVQEVTVVPVGVTAGSEAYAGVTKPISPTASEGGRPQRPAVNVVTKVNADAFWLALERTLSS